MNTFTVALIVCTALCLLWKESRNLGILGVAALVLMAPLLVGALVIIAGLIYYIWLRRSRYEYIPAGKVLPPDEESRRRRRFGLLVLATGSAAALGLNYLPPNEGSSIHSVWQGVTRSAPAEEILVVRTPGGLLQTATVKAEEMVDATFTHRIFGVKIGEVTPRIRCRAYYSYYVRLQPAWSVVRKDGVITALAPPLTPGLPVAIDTATIEKATGGTWLLVPFKGDDDLEELERTLTATLARKAASDEYRRRAIEESRKTIAEFIENWAVQSGEDVRSVRVLFEGEPVTSI
ncbi:MAG: hypothetical protein K1X42_17220 [Opitutaceae bacterium]|nr:hypothetical protein [Opitutaceae bacterium]